MYYELYIDVLFLVNLMMDFFLLLLARKIVGSSASYLKICLGSLIGAVGICIAAVLPVSNILLRFILFHFLLSGCMVKFGLGTKGRGEFLKGFISLYLGGFLLGGAFQWMSIRFRNFIWISISSYLILSIGLMIYSHFQKKSKRIYTVNLWLDGKQQEIMGLRDTGNSLRDPVTGRPVNIVQYSAIEQILPEELKVQIISMFDYEIVELKESGQKYRLHYIPFQSIGKQDGILPGMIFDKLHIQGEDELPMEHPVIALCKTPLSSKENYQMILHPEIVGDQGLFK